MFRDSDCEGFADELDGRGATRPAVIDGGKADREKKKAEYDGITQRRRCPQMFRVREDDQMVARGLRGRRN